MRFASNDQIIRRQIVFVIMFIRILKSIIYIVDHIVSWHEQECCSHRQKQALNKARKMRFDVFRNALVSLMIRWCHYWLNIYCLHHFNENIHVESTLVISSPDISILPLNTKCNVCPDIFLYLVIVYLKLRITRNYGFFRSQFSTFTCFNTALNISKCGLLIARYMEITGSSHVCWKSLKLVQRCNFYSWACNLVGPRSDNKSCIKSSLRFRILLLNSMAMIKCCRSCHLQTSNCYLTYAF